MSQPVGDKQSLKILGSAPGEIVVRKLYSFGRYFSRRLRDLMANVLTTKHAVDNRRTAFETTKVSLTHTKISSTLVNKNCTSSMLGVTFRENSRKIGCLIALYFVNSHAFSRIIMSLFVLFCVIICVIFCKYVSFNLVYHPSTGDCQTKPS